jgi:SAM-dependent methyltransferase
MTPSGNRRSDPPFWDHQFFVLRGLRRAIERMLIVIAPPPGSRVVDLGCGDRPYEPLLRARGCEYLPCDIDGPPEVQRIEPGKPLPFAPASADGVVSFQVLEHVWDVEAYLGETHRILHSGGWLLLSTHGSWPYHPHPGDYRRWTRAGLLRELETRGFVVEKVEPVVGLLALTTQYRLLGLHHALQGRPGLGAILMPLASLLMNACMCVEEQLTPPSVREDNACVYVVLARRRA